MNPNDEKRNNILQYFYDRNSDATSQYGKKGSSVKISDAKKELKAKYGLSQKEVMSNLTYLIDKGWINKTDIEKTFKTQAGSIPSVVTWYEISADGIDKLEEQSEFKQAPKYAGININATGQNVITLGDGNVVNAKFADLHAALDELKAEVTASEKVDDDQKLDVVVDIESLKDQLAKSSPNKTIIGHLWSGIEKVVTSAGMVDVLTKVTPLVAGLLP